MHSSPPPHTIINILVDEKWSRNTRMTAGRKLQACWAVPLRAEVWGNSALGCSTRGLGVEPACALNPLPESRLERVATDHFLGLRLILAMVTAQTQAELLPQNLILDQDLKETP